MPAVPTSTAWITYLRCHDDIGWAMDDADAAAVGLNGYLHRAFLSDWYSGQFPGSPADGLVFQHNPATGDRRISGSAAALVGLDRAVRDGDEAATQVAIDRLLLAHAIVVGFGGIPVLWMGDELGLPNDAGWASEPGHGDDNRWVHRPRMPWAMAGARHAPGTVPERVFAGVRHLVEVRAATRHLNAAVQAEVLDASDPGVLAVLRRHPLGPFLALYNVTEEWRPWPGAPPRRARSGAGPRPAGRPRRGRGRRRQPLARSVGQPLAGAALTDPGPGPGARPPRRRDIGRNRSAGSRGEGLPSGHDERDRDGAGGG